jgi:zinc transport system ATP-binding protein
VSRTAVSFRDVWFGYGRTDVLEGLALDVAEGTFTALIGPNGAGKTTMLRLLLGLETPRRGEVTVFGEAPGSRGLRIGYVPQRTGVPDGFPLSAEEAVLMGRFAIIGMGRRPARADRDAARQALARVNLEHVAGRRFSELSGGQQRRALIARALVGEPRLLLLDEPTAGLDPAAQARFYDMCCVLQREEHLTLIAASHDVDVVAQHADTVLLIDRTVKAMGPPAAVLHTDQLDRVYDFPRDHVHRSMAAGAGRAGDAGRATDGGGAGAANPEAGPGGAT